MGLISVSEHVNRIINYTLRSITVHVDDTYNAKLNPGEYLCISI